MTTKRRGIILLMAGIWLISSVHALYAQDTYRSEFALEYCLSEDEADNESDIYGVAAEIYFSPVDASNHPYAEAAFLERVGSIRLLAGQGERDAPYGPYTFDGDEDFYGATLTFAKAGSPIFIQAGYVTSEIEVDELRLSYAKAKQYHFSLGHFFSDGLLLAASYNQGKNDFDAFFQEIEFDNFSASAKLVTENPDNTAITIGGSITLSLFDYSTSYYYGWSGLGADSGENMIVNVYGDYYFNHKISLGGALSLTAGDWEPDEGATASINGNVHINPVFSVYGTLQKFFADNSNGEDRETLVFGLSARL